MLCFSTATLLIAGLATRVYAHGYVNIVTIDGVTYPGNAPGHDTVSSPIRTVVSNSPITNTSDADLACGLGALAAPLDAVASPGSSVNFTWVSGGGGNWPHEVGPVLTYMASCMDATTCAGFNATAGLWSKIDEAARMDNSSKWVQELIMEGYGYNVTIPEDLAPGAYLIRNELIGLQNAMAPGGAEYFPSCTQLRITGDGTEMPTPNSTVTFPGAYNETDPGLLVDVYTDPDLPYEIPGPPLATFVNGTSQDNSTSSPSTGDKIDDATPASAQPGPGASSSSMSSSGPTPNVPMSASTSATTPQHPENTPLLPLPDSGPASDEQSYMPLEIVDATPLQPVLPVRRDLRLHSRVMGRIVH